MFPTVSVSVDDDDEPLVSVTGFGENGEVEVVTPDGRPDIDRVIVLDGYEFWLVAVTVRDAVFPCLNPIGLGDMERLKSDIVRVKDA